MVEMQARYFALLASGHASLPSMAEMKKTIDADQTRLMKQYWMDAPRLGVLVDYLPYLTVLLRQSSMLWVYVCACACVCVFFCVDCARTNMHV